MITKNRVKLEFPAKSVNEAFARITVAAFVSRLDPTVEALADIKTAVSEAVTNAIVHAYANGNGTVYMTCRCDSDSTVTVTVRDTGCGIGDIALATQPMFTTDSSGERSGMGFSIMQSFMDKVSVSSKPGKGTRVTMKKKL